MAAARHGVRLVAVAAAVLASSGCLLESRPGTGSAALYWAFWSHSLGDIGDVTQDGATSICSRAAVGDVRITFTDARGDVREPSDGPCIPENDVPGAAFDALEPGTWGYELEGRRAGVTVFRASGTFEVADGERAVVDVRARAPDTSWDVVVAYTTSGCAAGDRLRFELLDDSGGSPRVAFSTDDAAANPPVEVPCDPVVPFTLPSVRPRAYTFSDWTLVDAGGTAKAYGTCRPSWTQGATADTSLSVDVSAVAAPPAGNGGVCL